MVNHQAQKYEKYFIVNVLRVKILLNENFSITYSIFCYFWHFQNSSAIISEQLQRKVDNQLHTPDLHISIPNTSKMNLPVLSQTF